MRRSYINDLYQGLEQEVIPHLTLLSPGSSEQRSEVGQMLDQARIVAGAGFGSPRKLSLHLDAQVLHPFHYQHTIRAGKRLILFPGEQPVDQFQDFR